MRARIITGLVFLLFRSLPLSQPSNASWTDQEGLEIPGTTVQSDALDGLVTQETIVPGTDRLGVRCANLAVELT